MQHSNNKSKISMKFTAKRVKNKIFKKKVVIIKDKSRRHRVRSFKNRYKNPRSQRSTQPYQPASVPTFIQPPRLPYPSPHPYVQPPPHIRPFFHPRQPPYPVPPPPVFMQQVARINALETALGQLMQCVVVQNTSDSNGGNTNTNQTGNGNVTMNGYNQLQPQVFHCVLL